MSSLWVEAPMMKNAIIVIAAATAAFLILPENPKNKIAMPTTTTIGTTMLPVRKSEIEVPSMPMLVNLPGREKKTGDVSSARSVTTSHENDSSSNYYSRPEIARLTIANGVHAESMASRPAGESAATPRQPGHAELLRHLTLATTDPVPLCRLAGSSAGR